MNQIDRRTAIRWAGTVATLVATGGLAACSSGYLKGDQSAGYGKDPPLLEPKRQPWPKLLTTQQQTTLIALVDTILPATKALKSASEIGVMTFFDEWLSAPYPDFIADQSLIIPLLDRLQNDDKLPLLSTLTKDLAFQRLRILSAAAYYTSPYGQDAIGFVGNEPRASFDGPPQIVLEHFTTEYAKLKGQKTQ